MFLRGKEQGKKDSRSIKFSKRQKINKFVILYGLIITMALLILMWALGQKNIMLMLDNKFQQVDILNLENKTADVINQSSLSIVTISDDENKLKSNEYSEGNLSGVVLREDGIIATSYTKVIDYENIYVRLPSVGGNPMLAQIIYSDEILDIVLIKINVKNLPAIDFADSSDIKEGRSVIALGNAVNDEYIGIVTRGIINSTNKTISEDDKLYRVIQVDSVLNEHNFGGAVVTSSGNLIGICSEYLTNKYNDGFYYIVEGKALIESVKKYFESMDKLGIRGGSLDQKDYNLSGVYVVSIDKDSLSHKAGLKPTDIIISIDNIPVRHSIDIFRYFKEAQEKKDKEILFKVLRDGKESIIKMDISK
ncbi:MAG: S1C family serine protease [Clostridium sp.]